MKAINRMCILWVCFLTACASEAGQSASDQESLCSAASFDLVLEAFRMGARLPGAAGAILGVEDLTIAVAGETTWGGDQLRPDSAMHFGSNGKAVTASLIGLLDQAGVVDLDTTVGAVFGDEVHTDYRNVTVRMLLAHRAGLPPYTSDESWEKLEGEVDQDATRERKRFTRAVLSIRPEYRPGSETHYSNAGYGVAAAIVETATGQKFEDLMRTQLWAPLNIEGGFGMPTENLQGAALGHAWSDTGYTRKDVSAPVVLRAAGDMFFEFDDYARFAQAHLRGLAGLDTEPFTSALVKRLHSPEGRYALGWSVQEYQGEELHLHLGGAGTFLALVALFPERERGLVLAVNGGGGGTEPSLVDLFKFLAELCTG